MVSPPPREPVVVEPVVNTEKLRQLLALETEYATLDFKRSSDLGEKRDLVELVKDVGAMSVRGGYLVIGVDGQGIPTGLLTEAQARHFDEAQLHSKLRKWLPATLEICSQVHEIDGHRVGLVYVAPYPAGCVFFRADGQHDQAGKASKVVFREGEVFFRDGTESVRLNQHGLELVIQQRVAHERELWEAQHAESYRRLAAEVRRGAVGQQVAEGAAAEFNLALEPDVLVETAIELMRREDDIPLRRMLLGAVVEVRALLESGDEDGVVGVIDRLTSVAAASLELRRRAWFELVIEAVGSIYGVGYEGSVVVNVPPRGPSLLWLTIIEHVMALGSLAVRRQDWAAVGDLATQQHPQMQGLYRSWLQHAMAMAHRAGLLTVRNDGTGDVDSVLGRARNVVRRLAWLRADTAPEDEGVLNGLTQFDFLASLITMSNSNNNTSNYPDFARYRGERTQSVARLVLTDPALRQCVYPGDDHQLAVALNEIDREAQRVAFRYDGWYGYTQDVKEFIREQGIEATSW